MSTAIMKGDVERKKDGGKKERRERGGQSGEAPTPHNVPSPILRQREREDNH